MSAARDCLTCAHSKRSVWGSECLACLLDNPETFPKWTPIEVIPETVPQGNPAVIAEGTERNNRPFEHLLVPARTALGLKSSPTPSPKRNWAALVFGAPKNIPEVPGPPSRDAPDTGYGCPTCKFFAVDPNAAPCRGCWSPSVSGKGSNWTAP